MQTITSQRQNETAYKRIWKQAASHWDGVFHREKWLRRHESAQTNQVILIWIVILLPWPHWRRVYDHPPSTPPPHRSVYIQGWTLYISGSEGSPGQTASRSLCPFLQGSPVWPAYTHRERQTNAPRYICSNRPRLASAAMRPTITIAVTD